METSYAYNLTQLNALTSNLPDEEAEAAEVLADFDPKYGTNLLKCISPGKEQSKGLPFPRYTHKLYKARGGEGLIILGVDNWESCNVIVKFCLPIKTDKKKEAGLGRKGLFKEINVFRQREQRSRESEQTARFSRGAILQQKLARELPREPVFAKGVYIPRVYSIGATPTNYIIMEYIPGAPFLEWCEDKSERERLGMYCRALYLTEYIHDCQIIHTDLTPDNFLILNEVLSLIDFGIAKNLNVERTKVTNIGSKLGKVRYASEEQIKSSWQRDYQSDIYILGFTLWSIINGAEPDFTGVVGKKDKQGNISYNHDEIRARYPNTIFDNVALRFIYDRATAKDKGDRYQDIVDFREDIEQVIKNMGDAGGPVCVPPCEPLQEVQKTIDSLKKAME